MSSEKEILFPQSNLELAFAHIDPNTTSNLYIFDMDGTLYQLDGDNNGYRNSTLEQTINSNSVDLAKKLEGCDTAQAQELVELGIKDYVGLSNFFSNRFSITREELFQQVWDIAPEHIINNYQTPITVVRTLAQLPNTKLALLTSAPRIWQKKIFEQLQIDNYFQAVVTADDFGAKPEVFNFVSNKYPNSQITSIGDQLKSDIEPAQALGFKTLLVTNPADLELLITDPSL